MKELLSLEGKTIIVTGVTSDIGYATAVLICRLGGKLILVGRNSGKIDRIIEEIGEEHKVIRCDFDKSFPISSLVNMLPPIDGLVNCIGATSVGLLKYLEEEHLHDVFESNVFIPIKLIAKLLQENKIRDNGSIVLISSIAGNVCTHMGGSVYSAAKAAISGFAKGIALELAAKGIRTNTILAGLVKTEKLIDSLNGMHIGEYVSKYPLKRLGIPDDVAHCAIYLLSDISSWITGSEIVLDGGFTLQ